MSDPDKFDVEAKNIYEAHKEEWEKRYSGKIIAIDVDANDLVSVGDHLKDVSLRARKERPDHRLFVRRVGNNPSVARLRNRNYA
ncbi:hypothetical protein [Methanosarcina barkeri]|uniref:DUF5678 domain-containing protein n=1 Tax=Methanosarcina barkeri 227 TaxID=1434106 RepID=A0A0E3R2D9_METBA|nr:hypothetical protein [Methanosarcina barkeri]AKB58678.1 hypothetical protein MSBR2_2162 [Methanosarcina barkeri 227]